MPYTNVPDDKIDAMDSCVEQVLAKDSSLEKENAVAICYTSVVEGKELSQAIKEFDEQRFAQAPVDGWVDPFFKALVKEKHLEGQHDQADHAPGGGGGEDSGGKGKETTSSNIGKDPGGGERSGAETDSVRLVMTGAPVPRETIDIVEAMDSAGRLRNDEHDALDDASVYEDRSFSEKALRSMSSHKHLEGQHDQADTREGVGELSADVLVYVKK
jgi:hypothetical protein